MVITGQGITNVLATMQLRSHLFSKFHVNEPLPLVIPLVLGVYIYFIFFSTRSLILHLHSLSFITHAGGIPKARLLVQVTEIHCVTVKGRSYGTQVTCGANAG